MMTDERLAKDVTIYGQSPDLPCLSAADLENYTCNFSEENYLGKFQFGKLYRGVIPGTPPKPVTVKVWSKDTEYQYYEGDNPQRLMDEVVLLLSEKFSHPGLMKLYGYYVDGEDCGIVYDFKPYDTLCNLLYQDNFNWLRRIKVAIGLARLLTFLHASGSRGVPLMLRNIDAAHVLVDKEWNPKLCDVSMINGGIFPDRTLYRTQHVKGCYGFDEPRGYWSQESDVYAFGVLLVCLMTNEYWSEADRRAGRPSVLPRLYETLGDSFLEPRAHEISWIMPSLEKDSFFNDSDGVKMMELALKCVNYYPDSRGTMQEALACLQELEVVCDYPDDFRFQHEPDAPEALIKTRSTKRLKM